MNKELLYELKKVKSLVVSYKDELIWIRIDYSHENKDRYYMPQVISSYERVSKNSKGIHVFRIREIAKKDPEFYTHIKYVELMLLEINNPTLSREGRIIKAYKYLETHGCKGYVYFDY